MTLQPVYLLCGVPGSGKTWCAKQVAHLAEYIPHDQFYENHGHEILKRVQQVTLPIVTECPFAERELRARLEKFGVKVKPYFVIEDPHIVIERYQKREGKRPGQNVITRATTIVKRAEEWGCPMGSSDEILELLKQELQSLSNQR